MTQSKTVYGIEQHMVDGLPEARGDIRELTTDCVAMLLDAWDFQYAVIHMPSVLMAFFPTKEAAERHLNECSAEVGPSYLRNFKFKGA